MAIQCYNEIDLEENMNMNKNYHDVMTHYLMAIVGGFFGGYAIFARMNVFGSAQTANLIDLIKNILGANYLEGMFRIGALLIYVLALILGTCLTYKTRWNLKYLVLKIEIICVILLSFIPTSVNPIVALYPCFFATAFQWSIFKGALGYTSSTIFSTNNIKQTVVSFTEYFLTDQPEKQHECLKKGCFFGGTLISFHSGVIFAYLLWMLFLEKSILFLLLFLFAIYTYLKIIDNIINKTSVKEKMIA